MRDGDVLGGMGDETSAECPTGRSWATGTAIFNALVMLYAANNEVSPDKVSAEDMLIRFFEAQEGNQLFDLDFAIRVCTEHNFTRAKVQLYGQMGMHEEAVEAALQRDYLALAKRNACKPTDKRLRKRLWLRIVESQAASGNMDDVTSLIRESQELSVRDVLPYMSGSVTIDAFQSEICDCLDKYEREIFTHCQEMEDHRRALKSFKEDLKKSEQRTILIQEDQRCEICGVPAVRERFFVFACKHCFHEACLRVIVIHNLSNEKKERLFSLEADRLEHAAAAAGVGTNESLPTSLAKVEEELDGILADDCPLCGRLMIQTITRPFIEHDREKSEIESWALPIT